MNWFYNTVALLREYGRSLWVAWSLILMTAILACGICVNDAGTMLFSLLPLVIVCWEISDVYLFRKLDSCRSRLADMEDEAVMLKGENVRLQDEVGRLGMIVRDRSGNPIKSNRIVSDRTFAVRFKWFVEEVRVSDPMSEEEAEYLISVAERLLKWQTRTVRKDSEEYRYLERLGLMPHPSDNAEERPEEAASPRPQKSKAKTVRKSRVTGAGGTGNENKD